VLKSIAVSALEEKECFVKLELKKLQYILTLSRALPLPLLFTAAPNTTFYYPSSWWPCPQQNDDDGVVCQKSVFMKQW
jgi:hypothetical protein